MIELGELRPTATGVRRFLLFQSLPQLISCVGCLALVIAFAEVAVYLMDGHPATPGVLFGALCGTLPAIWLSRRASLRVRGPERAQAWSVVDGYLCARVYRVCALEDGVHLYRLKLPRWLRWTEQDIRVSMDGDGMLVSGPYGALHGIRRLLATTFVD